MFTRRRKSFVALIALLAVVFAALMPATSALARVVSGDQALALGGICSAHDVQEPAPPQQVAAHGHCAFCSFGAPLQFAQRVDALLITLDAPASVVHRYRNDALPRLAVTFYPLSPRAPPRAL